MLKIATRDFGEKEISEADVLDFPNGVFAFEDDKRFALLRPLGDETYPMWLQSLDNSELCFIVYDPALIVSDYTVTLTESEKRILDVADGDPIRCLAIAKIPEDYRESTVNMKSPIIINPANNAALQVILPDDYAFRHPIFAAEEVQ